MKYYEDMLDKKCFSFKDAVQPVGGNCNTAKSLLRQYVQKGYMQQAKKNLYVTISIESGMPSTTRYQIASNIIQTSYVSHRSAFEYFGYTNQVSYELNVSSDTAFTDFEYEGMAGAFIYNTKMFVLNLLIYIFSRLGSEFFLLFVHLFKINHICTLSSFGLYAPRALRIRIFINSLFPLKKLIFVGVFPFLG